MNKEYPHNDFVRALVALPPEEVLGCARVLNVQILSNEFEEKDGKKQPKMRDGIEIINDILDKYAKLNRKQRRTMLKIVKAAK